MMKMSRKYWWIIIGLIVLILIAVILNLSGLGASAKVLQIESADSILSINSSSIYISNNKKIIKLPLNEPGKSFDVIDSDITLTNTSASSNKVYYVKGESSNSKSYIFDTTSNSIKEYTLYDEFLWVGNDGKFVDLSGGTATILNESLGIDYKNLPYPSYNSFARILLGSTVTQTPETQGYKWNVINQESAGFKNLSIENYKEETSPWSSGEYMLYTNSDDKLAIINNKGDIKTIDVLIDKKRLTNNDNDNQYYVEASQSILTIKALNLSAGSISDFKKINIASVLNANKLSTAEIRQVYYYNNSLYILISNKIMKVNL